MNRNISNQLVIVASVLLVFTACSEVADGQVEAVPTASTTTTSVPTTSAAPPLEIPTFAANAATLSDFGPVPAGTYRFDTLGTPFSIDFQSGLEMTDFRTGRLFLAEEASMFQRGEFERDWTNTVRFVRVRQLSGPSSTTSLDAFSAPLDATQIDDWIEGLDDGLLSGPPSATMVGGQEAIVFEINVDGDVSCEDAISCVGIGANPFVDQHFLRQGSNHRIWWVDQDLGAPVIVIAQSSPDGTQWLDDVELQLASLAFGDVEDSPIPPEAPWEAGVRATTQGVIRIPAFGGLELDLPQPLTVEAHTDDSVILFIPDGPPALIEILLPARSASGPLTSVDEIALVLAANMEIVELDAVEMAGQSARAFEMSGGTRTEDPVLFTNGGDFWFPPNSATIWLVDTDRGPLMMSAVSLFDPSFLGPITQLALEIGSTMRLIN